MLVIGRFAGQEVAIGKDITVRVTRVDKTTGEAYLGVTAPDHVQIVRDDAIKREPPPVRFHVARVSQR